MYQWLLKLDSRFQKEKSKRRNVINTQIKIRLIFDYVCKKIDIQYIQHIFYSKHCTAKIRLFRLQKY